MSIESPSRSDLLALYNLYVSEEQHFSDSHHTRIAYFSSMLSALFAATVTGFFYAERWFDYVALLVGPGLVIALAYIAKDAVGRLYQRFVETVTVRAKLEQALGLTGCLDGLEEGYWCSEPIIPPRHLASRRRYESAEEFIEANSTRGYQAYATKVFRMFTVLAFILMCGIAVRAAYLFFSTSP